MSKSKSTTVILICCYVFSCIYFYSIGHSYGEAAGIRWSRTVGLR